MEMLGFIDALVQVAHETNMPHQEPKEGSSDPAALFIVIGVVVTLAVLGALIWLKERMRKAEAAERADAEQPPEPDPA